MLNCWERLQTDPWGLSDRMADLCGLDRDRLRLWLFARAVVESSWWEKPGMAELATRLAPR
jgi:streptomycin 6-kinase